MSDQQYGQGRGPAPTRPVTMTSCLRRAIAYIEQGWTRGSSARNAKGMEVDAKSRQATCWCAEGALCRSRPPRAHFTSTELIREVAKAMDPHLNILWTWNDSQRTKQQVLAGLRRALRKMERVRA